VIGKPAAKCLFLDDNLANVETAKSMGIEAIHTPSRERVFAVLSELTG